MDRRFIRTTNTAARPSPRFRFVATTAAVTVALWLPVLGWPVLGAFRPGLAPGRIPGLHTGLLFLTAILTLAYLGTRATEVYMQVWNHGVQFGRATRHSQSDDVDDGDPAKVVSLRPRPRH